MIVQSGVFSPEQKIPEKGVAQTPLRREAVPQLGESGESILHGKTGLGTTLIACDLLTLTSHSTQQVIVHLPNNFLHVSQHTLPLLHLITNFSTPTLSHSHHLTAELHLSLSMATRFPYIDPATISTTTPHYLHYNSPLVLPPTQTQTIFLPFNTQLCNSSMLKMPSISHWYAPTFLMPCTMHLLTE